MIPLFGDSKERILTYDTKNIKKTNQDIIDEFGDKYADMKHDYQKVTYGSKAEMESNFLISIPYIDWSKVKTWADVGCGCANYFEYVFEHKGLTVNDFEYIKGLEPVEKFVDVCNAKNNLKGIDFEVANIVDYKSDRQYDLVSAIGILQVLNIDDVELVIEKLYDMTKPGGQIVITTSNFDYKGHKRRRIWWSCWAFKKEELIYILRDRHGCLDVTCDAYDRQGNIVELESSPRIFIHGYKPE